MTTLLEESYRWWLRVLGLAVYLGERPGSRTDWLNTVTTIAAVQAVMVGLATLALLLAAVSILRRLPARATTAGPGPARDP